MPNTDWRLLTADDAYEQLGYKTAKALREAAQRGLVPCVRIGRSVRFDVAALREWAANGGTPAATEGAAPQPARRDSSRAIGLSPATA
jgi:hypothetical protein